MEMPELWRLSSSQGVEKTLKPAKSSDSSISSKQLRIFSGSDVLKCASDIPPSDIKHGFEQQTWNPSLSFCLQVQGTRLSRRWRCWSSTESSPDTSSSSASFPHLTVRHQHHRSQFTSVYPPALMASPQPPLYPYSCSVIPFRQDTAANNAAKWSVCSAVQAAVLFKLVTKSSKLFSDWTPTWSNLPFKYLDVISSYIFPAQGRLQCHLRWMFTFFYSDIALFLHLSLIVVLASISLKHIKYKNLKGTLV